MLIGHLSVSCEVEKKTMNTSDTAIGRYINHILMPMTKLSGKSDQLHLITNQNSDVDYSKEKIKVFKLFKKNMNVGWNIYTHLKKTNYDLIHFQHEFFIYGGIPQSFLITLALFFIRKPKKIITAHHILDISKLDKKTVVDNNYNYPVLLVKVGLTLSYIMMALATNKIIVHEDEQKKILENNLRKYLKNISKKIVVIPHGIGKKKNIVKDQARNKLNLKSKQYIIFFGYVSKHKGLDLFLNAIQRLQAEGRDISGIIAGGYHPKLKLNLEYKNYYDKLFNFSKTLNNVAWLGFAEDKDLSAIFSAADLAVFPYTTRNATSGSVTDAIAYSVPFILSSKFNTITDYEGLFFELNVESLSKKIILALDGSNRTQAVLADLQSKYDWAKISIQLKKLYITP